MTLHCESCGFDNPPAMKFCGECGSPLTSSCSHCGFKNRSGFKFCGACGAALEASHRGRRVVDGPTAQPELAASSERPPAERAAAEPERRQLTVLFCDLVDSTALASQLDPEELREVVRAYQTACAAVIQPLGGHIAQYLGDGLLVYFGYPQAHEDDGPRAVRAALGLLAAIEQFNQRWAGTRGVTLALRVGIHTGLVVVGEMGSGGRHEQLALGETPNVAARLQAFAAPDTIVISAATHRLVRRSVECRELGFATVKGVRAPVRVFRPIRETAVQRPPGSDEADDVTPLVGREEELALLQERWLETRGERGHIVVVSGEAGIGKSRLVRALTARVAAEPHTRLESRASPYHQHSALYPVIELLHGLVGWRHDDGPEANLHELETALERTGAALRATVPLLASLLALPLPDRYAPLALAPARQKQNTFDALLTWIRRETERQPVLLILEDLQWLDPSTLEFLTLLIEHAPTMRLLLLLTCRPAFRPSWATRERLTHLTLGRLPPEQTAQMVDRVVGGKSLPPTVREELIAKTDGVPLFVEELTKMVLESPWLREEDDRYELEQPFPPLAIPTTLHDSLMARLDRLATAKPVAQLGATIGREFSYGLLRAVSPLGERALRDALDQLVETELLHRRGAPPHAVYAFKHILIQEAAYQSLVRSTRSYYHHRIAQVLAEQFPETVDTQPELLAHHYTEAGLSEHAISFWRRAGERAIAHSANIEAIGHLGKGLELLKGVPDDPRRTRHELVLQLSLGSLLLMMKGHTAPDVEQAYRRAEELCAQVDETPERCAALAGLWRFHLGQGRFDICRALARECFELARRLGDPALLQEAHAILGSTLFYVGELSTARRHLDEGIGLIEVRPHPVRPTSGGRDPLIACLCWSAWTLWLLGYPDGALARMRDALALARQRSHMYSVGLALYFSSTLHMWRREVDLVSEAADAVIAIARDHGFARWLGGAMIKRGWMHVARAEADQGIEPIRQGVAAWRATAGELGLPGHLARLAEVTGKAGHPAHGLRVVDEALAIVDKNGERYNEAELYRLRGELLLLHDPSDERSVEVAFARALAVARGQDARSWELRAATSLARFWQTQGRREEARDLLAPVYAWFTEGLDTADLQDAKALLHELA